MSRGLSAQSSEDGDGSSDCDKIEDAHGYGLDLVLILGRAKEEGNRDPSGGDLAEGRHRMSCISYASLLLMVPVQIWPIISPRWLGQDVVLYR
jgi:hypothetical protein